jgi:hypothetical protein
MKSTIQSKCRDASALLLGLCLTSMVSGLQAQTTDDKAGAMPVTRSQVRMERDDFLKSHTYDAANEIWQLKGGMEPPMGVKTKAEIRAERDEFLRNNWYDLASESWVPVKGTPRVLSSLTREQVRAETRQFTRTHRWDEVSETWVEKTPWRKKK